MVRVVMVERGRDLSQQLVANDAMAELDSGSEFFRVGAAMAFSAMPFNPRKTPPLERRGSMPLSQLPERRTREQVADARAQRTGHGAP